jgi:hypothetical protein
LKKSAPADHGCEKEDRADREHPETNLVCGEPKAPSSKLFP